MKKGKIVLFLTIILLLLAGAFLTNHLLTESSGNALDTMADQDTDATKQNGTDQQDSLSPETGGNTGVENTDGEKTGISDSSTASGEQITGDEVQEEPELRFMAVGDIMLGRGVGFRLQKAGSYEKAFEKVTPVFKQGDVVFANLEIPFTDSSHGLDSKRKIVLKAKPATVTALTSAGINLLSLANNHMMDHYEKGLFDTMSILDEHDIAYAGAGRNMDEARKPAIIEKNGLKIGLLAYTDMAELVFAGDPYLSFTAEDNKSGVAPRKYEMIREDILKLRDQVDLIAVSLHWGVEDSFNISSEQVEFAHKLIDDGADLILGHHPHQFQGMEMYKGKPIIYSMGNFVFDQNDPENMESFIVDMKYKGTELVEFSAIPVRILEKSYVEIQTGDKASNILERQAGLCKKLGAEPVIENDLLVMLRDETSNALQ